MAVETRTIDLHDRDYLGDTPGVLVTSQAPVCCATSQAVVVSRRRQGDPYTLTVHPLPKSGQLCGEWGYAHVHVGPKGMVLRASARNPIDGLTTDWWAKFDPGTGVRRRIGFTGLRSGKTK